jgi:hypothetical protein
MNGSYFFQRQERGQRLCVGRFLRAEYFEYVGEAFSTINAFDVKLKVYFFVHC